MIAGRMADHDVHRSRRIRCQMDCVSKRKGGDSLDWRQVALVAVTLSSFLLKRPHKRQSHRFLQIPVGMICLLPSWRLLGVVVLCL